MKKRIYDLIESTEDKHLSSKIFSIFINLLIVLNIFAVILETVSSIYSEFSQLFKYFEYFSILIFSIEYLMRVWVCVVDLRYKSSIKGRFKYILTPLSIIDLLAIIPFYIPFLIPYDLRIIRIFRLVRLFKLFKIGKYADSVKLFGVVLKKKKEELLLSLMAVSFLLIFSSSIMYYAEHEAQPELFTDILSTMWWGVATLSTVGYGDIYPITTVGKIIGSIISLLGIGLFALPAGILASGFTEVFKSNNATYCSKCGNKL